ncbi:MAG: DUF502 domain-containing protein, partial [Tepidisphaeraceae bacterium]
VESMTRELSPVKVPFAGVALAVIAIYLIGLFVTSFLGKWFLGLLDKLLMRLPVLKELYKAWKHVSLTPGGGEGVFGKVCLLPDETGQMMMLGFTSGEAIDGDADTLCVFVPNSPNPVQGKLYFARREKVRMTTLSAEEAFKVLLSTGNYVPSEVAGAIRELAPD